MGDGRASFARMFAAANGRKFGAIEMGGGGRGTRGEKVRREGGWQGVVLRFVGGDGAGRKLINFLAMTS
jgi:hypothetical protein